MATITRRQLNAALWTAPVVVLASQAPARAATAPQAPAVQFDDTRTYTSTAEMTNEALRQEARDQIRVLRTEEGPRATVMVLPVSGGSRLYIHMVTRIGSQGADSTWTMAPENSPEPVTVESGDWLSTPLEFEVIDGASVAVAKRTNASSSTWQVTYSIDSIKLEDTRTFEISF